MSLCTVERAVLLFRRLLTAEAKATVRFETDRYSGRGGRGRRCPARVGLRQRAGSVDCWLSGPGPGLPGGRRAGRTNSYRGEGRDRDFSSLGKSRAVAITLFAVKRHGDDTMLVVEAASADAANGWLVFRCADGRPLATLASLRLEDVLRIERPSWLGLRTTSRTVSQVAAGPLCAVSMPPQQINSIEMSAP